LTEEILSETHRRIFKGRDLKEGRKVVITVPLNLTGEDLSQYSDYIESLKKLKHKCIVPVLSMEKYEDTYFFVRDYIPGKTLRERLFKKKNFSVDMAVEIAIYIGEIINYAHSHAMVVHGDLRPENIIFSGEGNEIKIVDFGMNFFTGVPPEVAGYYPSEAFEGERGTNVDRWSFGVILYEMLTGNKTFHGNIDKTIPSELSYILQKTLNTKVSRRYRDISEILNDLKTFTRKGRISFDTASEVETLIRARYVLIYIVTYEEERVIRKMQNFSLSERKFYYWTLSRGLLSSEGENMAGTSKPVDILTFIDNYKKDGKSIFFLMDFHPFLKDPTIQSQIKNLAIKLRETSNNIIFISPLLALPVELEKIIRVLDYPLPDTEEIEELLQRLFSLRLSGEIPYRDIFIDACRGLTLRETERVMERIFSLQNKPDGSSIKEILEEKRQIIRKTSLLEFYLPEENFEHIGGLLKLKNWLKKRGKAFTSIREGFSLDNPRGVLLLGVPGCGKSLVAKALSGEWKRPLLKLDTGRLFSPLMGSSEENLRKAINTTEAMAPAILWLDNIDRGFCGVQKSTDSGVSARIFGSFINWLQEKSSLVFVIATAGNIFDLPPEFLRKGRFDEIFFIDLPQYEERRKIFEIYTDKWPLSGHDLDLLGRNSNGFSGFEIKKSIISALYDSYEREEELSSRIILENMKTVVPLSDFLKGHISFMREWAERNGRSAS